MLFASCNLAFVYWFVIAGGLFGFIDLFSGTFGLVMIVYCPCAG